MKLGKIGAKFLEKPSSREWDKKDLFVGGLLFDVKLDLLQVPFQHLSGLARLLEQVGPCESAAEGVHEVTPRHYLSVVVLAQQAVTQYHVQLHEPVRCSRI